MSMTMSNETWETNQRYGYVMQTDEWCNQAEQVSKSEIKVQLLWRWADEETLQETHGCISQVHNQ